MASYVDFPQIVGSAYTYPSWPIDCQESVNFEPLPIESKDSPYKSMLIATPGYKKIKFLVDGDEYDDLPGNGNIRGVHRCMRGFGGSPNPTIVVVIGSYVYEILEPDNNGVCIAKKITELLSGVEPNYQNRVSMADGGGESWSNYPPKLVIVDGTYFTVINMDSTKTETIPLNEAPCCPDFVSFLDSRIFAIGKDVEHNIKEGRVYWSDINDPSSWDPTNFITAALLNDHLKCIKNVGNSLWLIGTDSFEVWQTTTTNGTLYSPIRKVFGSSDGVGTASGDSVATISNRIYFVGGGATGHTRIYEGEGTKVHYISTDAMEQEMTHYDIYNSIGFCYSDEGRSYYVVTFLNDDVTWVYCYDSKSWHKRSSRGNGDVFHKWDIGFAAYCYNKIFVGDVEGKGLYFLSSKEYTEDGRLIVRTRRTPHIVNSGNYTRHASFTLELETGTAIPNEKEPMVMLQALDDCGRIKRGERWISTGRTGNYRKRLKWYRLGQARDRVYEIKVSEPVKWVIYGAKLEIEVQKGGL